MQITIINSAGHWHDGWLTRQEAIDNMTDALHKSGFKVKTVEVSELKELEAFLKTQDPRNLILPNAYHVNSSKNKGELVWMADVLEKYQLPYIGSSSKALQNLIRKDVCQRILKAHDIPIPEFVVINQADRGKERGILKKSKVGFPAIVKLTNTSGSVGISQESIVFNHEEAITQVRKLLKNYPGDIIIEEFLSSDDITISYFAGNGKSPKLISTYYRVPSQPGATHVLGREEQLLDWGESKLIVPIRDENILRQAKEIVPRIVEALGIKDVTRVDGRLDSNGQLKFFDINGYPGLLLNGSSIVEQCNVCFPNHSNEVIYDALINTIMMGAAHRYGMNLPKRVGEHNLFTLGEKLVSEFTWAR